MNTARKIIAVNSPTWRSMFRVNQKPKTGEIKIQAHPMLKASYGQTQKLISPFIKNNVLTRRRNKNRPSRVQFAPTMVGNNLRTSMNVHRRRSRKHRHTRRKHRGGMACKENCVNMR